MTHEYYQAGIIGLIIGLTLGTGLVTLMWRAATLLAMQSGIAQVREVLGDPAPQYHWWQKLLVKLFVAIVFLVGWRGD